MYVLAFLFLFISATNLAPFVTTLVQTTSEWLGCTVEWAVKGMFCHWAYNSPQSCDSCRFVSSFPA